MDTSYRIFNQQKVMKAKLYTNDQSRGSMFNVGREEQDDELSPLKSLVSRGVSRPIHRCSLQKEPNGCSVESLPFKARGMPNLYGVGEEEDERAEEEDVFEGTDAFDAIRNLDLNYVNCPRLNGWTLTKLPFQDYPESALYSTQLVTSARCYSPDSGTSHEMIFSGLQSAGVHSSSPQSRPSPVVPPLFRPTPADSLLYSPAGTAASSLADTSAGGMSSNSNGTRPPDSPTNPPYAIQSWSDEDKF